MLKTSAILACILLLIVAGCANTANLEIMPTSTPIPSATPEPTSTPEPTPTPIPDENLIHSCVLGVCQDLVVDRSCTIDDDCMLVNQDYGLSCCWAGRCDIPDYSRIVWIAVNSSWFADMKTRDCPAEKCGPAPMCPTRMGDPRYHARCVEGVCQKVIEVEA